MAKLNVVIPAVEVEVNGQKYRKVDREAQAGDIIKAAEIGVDISMSAFYAVFSSEYGTPSFHDDDGDERHTYVVNHEVYEKVTETEYREVDRKAKVGERIRIVDCDPFEDDYEDGAEFTVNRADSDGDVYVTCGDDDDKMVRYYEYVVLEPAEKTGTPQPAQARRLTVGDYVKVVGNECYHNYKIGSIVRIVEDEHDYEPYRAEMADGTIGNWLSEADVEPATKEEFEAQKRFKVGDYVKVTDDSGAVAAKKGDIGVVTNDNWGDTDGSIIDVKTLDGREYGMFSYRFARATEAEVEAAKKAAERTKAIGEFANGGYAQIINATEANANSSVISSGGRYVVVKVTEGYRKLALYDEKGDRVGFCNADALRKVTKEEYEEEIAKLTKPKPTFNVGDTVKLSVPEGKDARFGWGNAKNGDIGKVARVDSDRVYVDFPSQSYWNADPSELPLLTEEEVAKISEEVKWASIGRRVNEFKRGDIVQFSKYDGLHGLNGYDEIITEVIGFSSETDRPKLKVPGFVDTCFGTYTPFEHLTLIVPVEQRFDSKEAA